MKLRFFKSVAFFAILIAFSGVIAPSAFAKTPLPVVISRGFSDELSSRLIGNYAVQIGDLKLTALSYEQSWRKNPSSEQNFQSAVRAHLMTGNYSKALEIAKSADDRMQSSEANLVLANDAFLRKSYSTAIELLKERDANATDAAYAQQLLAWSLLGNGDYEAAMNKAAEITSARNLEKSVYYARGILYDFAGDKQKASDAFEIAYASGSRVSLGLVSYAQFLIKNQQKDKALSILRDTGNNHAANEYLFETEQQIISENFPPKAKPQLGKQAANALGIIAIAMSEDLRNGSPLGSLAMASSLDKNALQVKLNLGAMLIGLGLKEEGMSILRSIPTKTVFGDQAQGLIANIIFPNEPKEALKITREIYQSRPNFSNKVALASILLGNENYGEADALYTELLKEFPQKSAQEANVEKWQLLFGRANASLVIGKTDQAIKDLRTALILEPNNSMVLNTLGYTLAQENIDLDEAQELIEKSLSLNPQSGETIDSLGWVLFKKGKYEEALDQLEIAFALSPTIGEVAEHLGDAYWTTDRKDEARLEWGKALSLYKSAKDKAKVKSKIENGLMMTATQTKK